MNPEALSALIVPGTDPDVVACYEALAGRSLTQSFGLDEPEVCVVDLETTGYEPSRDHVIEVAAAIMRGPEVVDRYSTLVDPLIPVPPEITKLTGIDDDMLAGAPPVESAMARLVEFAGSRDLVAHNAQFDRSFVERVAGRGALRGRWLDSLVFVRIGLPRLRSHRLADLAGAFVPDAAFRAHRAADDVEALTRIWRIALCGIAEVDPGVLARIARLGEDAAWAEREWLARISAASPDAIYDLKEVRRRRVAADRAEAMNDADDVECRAPESGEVCEEFGAEGIVGRMYPGFEPRAEQVEMAAAVLEAFGSDTHLAVEAGTGVGKSVAYLIPAAFYSRLNGVGVGVATKTNALMDQLVYHELPRLADALGGELRYAALKGYDHYPCLRKLEKFAAELPREDDGSSIGAVAMLLAWTSQSSWGDLDAVNLHWRRHLRRGVQASQADCTKKRCRYFPHLCYLHGVRRRAASANIVVTNHALLFTDVVAGGVVLPPLRHWIVDEAHAAESEARRQLTLETSNLELGVVLGALHSKRGGLLSTIRRALGGADDVASVVTLIAQMEQAVERCSTLATSLFDFVKDLAPLAGSSDYDSAELWINEEVRSSGPWGTVASTGASLARRLTELVAEGRRLVTALEESGPDLNDQRADLIGLITRLADQLAGVEAVVDGSFDELVYSAELDRRPSVPAERLVAARLDVGEALAEWFYPRARSVVYTSATMATGDSFDHFARGVGLDRLEQGSVSSLKLASSYDFERQMAVFVPSDLPAPNEAGYSAALESLLEQVHLAMGGSVLTLFTNRREMERQHALLAPRLQAAGLELLVQGRGTSKKRLRDEFIADERLSLFALKSFWEGFDAQGDTLRCVVVPRLPFGRPTDPLACERERREGRDAWSRYALPEAIIELKQAAGRLIRSSTDTGCLVIADSRVLSKGYGGRFLASLPVADVERMPSRLVAEAIAARFGVGE